MMVSSSDRPFRDDPNPVSDRMISQPAALKTRVSNIEDLICGADASVSDASHSIM